MTKVSGATGVAKSTSNFSRDAIGVEQLANLKERFADGDLSEQEFVDLFREIIDTSLSETQLTHLFQQIDANSDGSVDWDEFSNFMFLGASDSASDPVSSGPGTGSTASTSSSASSDYRILNPMHQMTSPILSHHKDLITQIILVDKSNQYLTSSKDGTVRMWNRSNLVYQGQLVSGQNWITDCSYMTSSNRLVMSSLDRKISFVDATSGQSLGQMTLEGKKAAAKAQAIPLCLEYIDPSVSSQTTGYLVSGDDAANVRVYACDAEWLNCDSRDLIQHATSSSSSSRHHPHRRTTTGGGGRRSQNNQSPAPPPPPPLSCVYQLEHHHSDWITRVKFIPDLQSIVTTSLDTTISILDMERLSLKFEYSRHRKGVYDVCWSGPHRLLVSCGMERDVSIWNPYSCQRSVATLRGHTASVCHVASNAADFQLFSVSSDNVMKVWDIRTYQCLQTLVSGVKPPHVTSGMAFDPETKSLITATNALTSWPLPSRTTKESTTVGRRSSSKAESSDDDRNKARSKQHRVYVRNHHVRGKQCEQKKPSAVDTSTSVTLGCYNSAFSQVVTSQWNGTSNVISTWNVDTGEEISHFMNPHGQNPVTTMTFDGPKRRLLTGSHDGQGLNMWNFSNGSLVKQFLKRLPDEKQEQRSRQPSTESSSYRTPKKRERMALLEDQDHSDILYAKSTDSSSFVFPRKTLGHQKKNKMTKIKMKTKTPSSSSSAEGALLQNEITCILDIERNVQEGVGNFVSRRYVCCAGWDQKVYIWNDENGGESKVYPSLVLPQPDERTSSAGQDESKSQKKDGRHHQDIVSMCYLPPSYLVTSGLDGQVILWNLNSGEFMRQVFQSSNDISMEAMCYSTRLALLFMSGTDGHLRVMNRQMKQILCVPLHHRPDEHVVVVLCLDSSTDHLISGDTGGHVKVWGITTSNEGAYLEALRYWQVGSGKCTTIEVVELDRHVEKFILVSCEEEEEEEAGSGNTTLWTMDGVAIGRFGGPRSSSSQVRGSRVISSSFAHSWSLDESILKSQELHSKKHKNENDPLDETKHLIRSWNKDPKVFIPCFSTSGSQGLVSLLSDETLPQVGEVWVSVFGPSSSTEHAQHLTSSEAFAHRILIRKSQRPREIEHVVTITSVSKGELIGWDGSSNFSSERQTLRKKTIPLQDFARSRSWVKRPDLSQYIGRTFINMSNVTSHVTYFKVVNVGIKTMDMRLSSREGAFFLMDTLGHVHPMQPIESATTTTMNRLKLKNVTKKIAFLRHFNAKIFQKGVLTTGHPGTERDDDDHGPLKSRYPNQIMAKPVIEKIRLPTRPHPPPRAKPPIRGLGLTRNLMPSPAQAPRHQQRSISTNMDFRHVHELTDVPSCRGKEFVKYLRRSRASSFR